MVQESSSLRYDQAGVDSIIPIGDEEVVTVGLQVLNRGTTDVVIQSVEIAEVGGLTADPQLVIGTPRLNGGLASEVGFPPAQVWDDTAEATYGDPIDLPAGVDSSDWGVIVLSRVERTDTMGYMKGFWVRGTDDGEPFEDFVDAYLVLCGDTDDEPSTECLDYATANGFASADD